MKSVKLYYSPSENVWFKHDITFGVMKGAGEGVLANISF